MFRFKQFAGNDDAGLLSSTLYNERSFYPAFLDDLQRATNSIIIESPFITYKRLSWLLPVLQQAINRGITIVINTRDPVYHQEYMQPQAYQGINKLQNIGVTVLYTGNHHRKLAIIDSAILWEGSLNILSQADSCEVMRRIDSVKLAKDMLKFIELDRWYTE